MSASTLFPTASYKSGASALGSTDPSDLVVKYLFRAFSEIAFPSLSKYFAFLSASESALIVVAMTVAVSVPIAVSCPPLTVIAATACPALVVILNLPAFASSTVMVYLSEIEPINSALYFLFAASACPGVVVSSGIVRDSLIP